MFGVEGSTRLRAWHGCATRPGTTLENFGPRAPGRAGRACLAAYVELLIDTLADGGLRFDR